MNDLGTVCNRKLEEILESEEAGTLMDHLPPAGLANLATKNDVLVVKNDLMAVRNELIGRMDGLDQRLTSRVDGLEDRLTARIEQVCRRLVMWM
jgi:hypothetical protein